MAQDTQSDIIPMMVMGYIRFDAGNETPTGKELRMHNKDGAKKRKDIGQMMLVACKRVKV